MTRWSNLSKEEAKRLGLEGFWELHQMEKKESKSLNDKVNTLREIRERYKFLIKAENNNSRKELYIKWKQEVEHLIDVIVEEKFEMDRQEQANERDFENYKKGV